MLKNGEYHANIDLWSLGIIFYEMVIGHRPYNAQNEVLLYDVITNTQLTFPNDKLTDKCMVFQIKDFFFFSVHDIKLKTMFRI